MNRARATVISQTPRHDGGYLIRAQLQGGLLLGRPAPDQLTVSSCTPIEAGAEIDVVGVPPRWRLADPEPAGTP